MEAKLRIGILLDSFFVPAWAFTAIKRMLWSNHAELVLVVINQTAPIRSPAHWLYQVFNAIDEKLFLRSPNALAPVDVTELFSDISVLGITPIVESEEQYFSVSDVEKIKSYQPDILIKMGFGRLHGTIVAAATHGLWTYRWGDCRKIEDGLTGFWEVVHGWPETGAALQKLGPNPESDITLFETWFSTYPYSPARNRNCILWAAASFLPRQVERLHRLGTEEYFLEPKHNIKRRNAALQSNKVPTNRMVPGFMMRLACRNFLEVSRRSFCRERWELLFNIGPDLVEDISEFRKISPPKDRFWADPHIVYEDPNYYIFIEEYLYRTRRGHISVIEMDQKGKCKPSVPVLEEDHHLSFPFVFDWIGHYYMIPESSENKTIDLYESVEFPHRWQHKLTLMKNVSAVDTTVIYRRGKWWLFTSIAEQDAALPQVELFLFYSNELFTNQWTPHPMNPIVSDVKRARGAGAIILKDARLIRPSQDCSIRYGYGCDLNEIDILSETVYHERTLRSIRPDSLKRILATHTYANRENLTVVDVLKRPPRWARIA